MYQSLKTEWSQYCLKKNDNVDSERKAEKKEKEFSGKSDCLRAGMLASVPLKEESEIRIEKEKMFLGIMFNCTSFIGKHVFNGLAYEKLCLEYSK